jgi:mannose-6-phosphate isomerase-like protein (cupin superfamily)
VAVMLEGGCYIIGMKEGRPTVHGTLRIWHLVGRIVGAQAISLRVLEFSSGLSPGLRRNDCDEIIYVLEGAAQIFIDGRPYSIQAEMGIYLRPGETLTIDNLGPEPLILISSQCPEPLTQSEIVQAVTTKDSRAPLLGRSPLVRLTDRRDIHTADRSYRVLVDDEVGSTQVTQFIGSIPPGRAPNHFHTYEEVLFILRGSGRMWAGETSAEINPGMCIYLPRRQVHCVENIGNDELRLLGVFYPAGSPSVRYDVN